MIKKNYISLAALVVLFIIPGIVAYFAFQDPSAFGLKPTNHGQFIKPPFLLSELKNNKKWRLVYFSRHDCTEECMGDLDKMARIRLALGRRLYNVDSYFFMPQSAEDLTEEQEKILQDVNISVLKFSVDGKEYQRVFDKERAFFIVSPENYLILSFAADTPSEDIFADLKKLVND